MTKLPAEKTRLPKQSREYLARAEHLHTAGKASDIKGLLGLQVEVGIVHGHPSAFPFLSFTYNSKYRCGELQLPFAAEKSPSMSPGGPMCWVQAGQP